MYAESLCKSGLLKMMPSLRECASNYSIPGSCESLGRDPKAFLSLIPVINIQEGWGRQSHPTSLEMNNVELVFVV